MGSGSFLLPTLSHRKGHLMYETLKSLLNAYMYDELPSDEREAFARIREVLSREPELMEKVKEQILAVASDDEVLVKMVFEEANRAVSGLRGAKEWMTRMYQAITES
jgi:hypothetical protein